MLYLRRLRRAGRPRELHDPGRCHDLEGSRRAARRRQRRIRARRDAAKRAPAPSWSWSTPPAAIPMSAASAPISHGLAPITAPDNALILTSATPGKVADDSNGAHSVLMTELLTHLNRAASPSQGPGHGSSVESVFHKTRVAISRASDGEQVPSVSSSLLDDVSFTGAVERQGRQLTSETLSASIPCESRDPYAVRARLKRRSVEHLSHNRRCDYAVPASAGTTSVGSTYFFASTLAVTGRTGSPSRSSAPARATTMSPSWMPSLISTWPADISPTSTRLVSTRAAPHHLHHGAGRAVEDRGQRHRDAAALPGLDQRPAGRIHQQPPRQPPPRRTPGRAGCWARWSRPPGAPCPSTSPVPMILIRAVWLTASLEMSRTGTMPTRSNSLRAMMENSASPLAPAIEPTTAEEVEISPAIGAAHQRQPALGQREPGQQLAGGDGIARLRQDFRHLQPRPLRAHRGLLPRDQDARHLDDIAETGLCGLEHGDRGALRRGVIVGGERGGGEEEEGGDQKRPLQGKGGCSEMGHRRSRPVSGAIDIRRRARGPRGATSRSCFP